jgi:hypothetical protein
MRGLEGFAGIHTKPATLRALRTRVH